MTSSSPIRTPDAGSLCRGPLVLALLLLFLLQAGAALAATTPVGTVVAVRGRVLAIDKAGAERQLAMKGAVFESDTIKTGKTGRIQLLFKDNTIVNLGRETEMAITDYDWQPEAQTGSMKTKVDEGTFRVLGGAITKVAPKNFSTETPAATIGIRGSMYAGKVKGDQLTVVLLGGKGINVTNEQGMVPITRAGFGTRVRSDAPPPPPTRFTADDMNDLNEGMSNGGNGQDDDTAAEEGEGEGQQEQGAAADEDEGGQDDMTALGSGGDDEQQPAADEQALTAEAPPTDQESVPVEEPAPLPLDTDLGTALTTAVDISNLTTLTTDIKNDTTVGKNQDEQTETIAETVTETVTVDMSGRYQGVLQWLDETASDENEGILSAQAVDGTVTVTLADGTTLKTFTIPVYDSSAAYNDLAGFSATDSVTRTVGPATFTTTRKIDADNLGEFFMLSSHDLLTLNSTDYEFSSLAYGGRPTTTAQMPASGTAAVDEYFGQIVYSYTSLDGATYDGGLGLASMEVNWLNGKVIGVIYDDSASTPGVRRGGIFFFADVADTGLANVRFLGDGDYDFIDSGSSSGSQSATEISTVFGDTIASRFYGSFYQGFGGTASGIDYSVYDQGKLGDWTATAAMFRHLETNPVTPSTGIASFEGFVVGIGEDMDAPATNRRIFVNSLPSDFVLYLDRDNGEILHSASYPSSLSASDLDSLYNSIIGLAIGGTHGSAYVLDDNFVALMGCSGGNCVETTYGLTDVKAQGNFLVTAEPAENYDTATFETGHQFSKYVTWGYWNAAYTEPGSPTKEYHIHQPGSLWIAGERTPSGYVSGLMGGTPATFTGHYAGPAYGTMIDSTNSLSPLTNGTSDIYVNFSGGTVNGSIDFDEASLPLDPSVSAVTANGFSAEINGASASSVNGAFYGPKVNAIGGNFNATMGSNRYTGIFGGSLVNGPAP